MPTAFVVAVDEVIQREHELGRTTAHMKAAQADVREARSHMLDVMPDEIDNAKVGYRLPDVFAWRRGNV
jgi:hypothetical protein